MMEEVNLANGDVCTRLLRGAGVVEPADSTVVTYYSDVVNEVDAHFARALLQQQIAAGSPQQHPSPLSSTYNEEDVSCT